MNQYTIVLTFSNGVEKTFSNCTDLIWYDAMGNALQGGPAPWIPPGNAEIITFRSGGGGRSRFPLINTGVTVTPQDAS
jgi:hypothetical protein